MKEIGSEFWESETLKTNNEFHSFLNRNIVFTMTGRTALNTIIEDIKQQKNIKNAYLPAYCCESMIRPFVDNNIDVEFYDVVLSKNGLKCNYDFSKSYDLVFLIQYFGFVDLQVQEIAKRFKEKNCFVIEDATHSLLHNKFSEDSVDYYFASLRKWNGIADGGFVIKNSKKELKSELIDPNNNFISFRNEAQNLKARFMNGQRINKDDFLSKFSDAENIINVDYKNYSISENSINTFFHWDIDNMRKKRFNNAKYLLNNLCDVEGILPLNTELDSADVPLFFPILIKNGKRNLLRKYLIDKKIYCPVHWPMIRNDYNAKTEAVYNEELSVVCDQRYDFDDMDRLILEIKSFMNSI